MNKSRLSILKLIFFLILIAHCPLLHSLSLDETLSELSPLSQSNNAQFRWDPLLQDGVFNIGDHYGAFSIAAKEGENGFLLFDNRELFSVPLPFSTNGNLTFPDPFVGALKDAFRQSFEKDSSRFHVTTIIIDPGHGGKDPGAVSKQTINGKTMQVAEKDIVLNAGKELKTLLNQTYPDKKIIMTRETDAFLTLEQRAEMANSVTVSDNEAVIFISIHANASVNPAARGYEVWHITSGYRRSLIDKSKHNYSSDITSILNAMLEEEYTTESILLADSILTGLGQNLGSSVPSRGRKANDWFVVRNSRMPAVLVELGFVSNPQDAVLMSTGEGLQKLIRSLYNGITNFIGIFERS